MVLVLGDLCLDSSLSQPQFCYWQKEDNTHNIVQKIESNNASKG